MPLKITFTISDKDLQHFRRRMRESRERASDASQADIIAASRSLLERVKSREIPEFLADRIGKLETLIDLVDDELWVVPDDMRNRVLHALAYFIDPHDIIPDDVPAIGFLDDAIMIELIVRELKHDIDAYVDFVQFDRARRKETRGRAGAVTESDSYKAGRERLVRRARRRTRRDRDRVGRRSRLV